MTSRAADLVQKGRTAARVGDLDEARRLLTAATRQAPDNIEAWLELAGVVDDLEQKRTCFQKVLDIDPDHAQAKAALSLLAQKLSPQFPDSAESDTLFCYRHPQTETSLRCNRCNKPICTKCAQRTPVGFRCPDCIREIEGRYYSQMAGQDFNPYERIPQVKPIVNFVLMGLIILIWLAMEAAGGSTSNRVLVLFGANFGPLILEGQYWRLFTSMFLHIGGQHLAFNFIGLVAFGIEMERIYGHARYLIIYLLTGLFGSLASFAINGPMQFSAGASGAIYGIVGLNFVFFWLYRDRLGEYGRRRRNFVLVLVGIGLALGLTVMPVDNFAHLGGFVAGIILGYGLTPRYRVDEAASSNRIIDRGSLLRRWWVPALGVLVFGGGLWLALNFWGATGGLGLPFV